MNKKGLSMIVSTLIIILLVLVAIGVIWAVVNKIITEGSDKITLDKFLIDLKVENAYADGGEMVVVVERGVGEGDLAGMTFVFSDGENNEIHSTTDTLIELGKGTYTFELTELSTANIQTVSVAPIYLAPSGDEVLGEVTDTNELSDEDVSGGGDVPGGSSCTPDLNVCLSSECGTELNGTCGGVNCGTCDPLTEECTNGQCVSNGCVNETFVETCTNQTRECSDWANNCGYMINCGTCGGPSVCNATGQCETLLLLSGGLVDSVWPGSAPTYFDSESLPKNNVSIVEYLSKYINFSSNAGLCYQINIAEYAPGIGGYNMSHLGFDYVIPHLVNNDTFDIWETDAVCQGNF